MTFEEFYNKHCHLCGTQRCIPSEIEWLEGCKCFKELNYQDRTQLITELSLSTNKHVYFTNE